MSSTHWVTEHWVAAASGAGGDPPATPVLAAVNNGDGTATATVSGSSAGATNTIHTLPIDNDFATNVWTLQGSRSGDGDVELSLQAGYYWVQCHSLVDGQSVVSNLVYLRVTDGTKAVLQQILDAVQSRIVGLSLTGIASDNILVRDVPTDRNVTTKPCIIIAPYRHEQMPRQSGTNVNDEVGYPVVVAIIDHQTGANTGEPDSSAKFKWRQDIVRAFRHQRLIGIAEVYSVGVEPLDIVDSSAWFGRNVHYSGLVLRVFTRESRGI